MKWLILLLLIVTPYVTFSQNTSKTQKKEPVQQTQKNVTSNVNKATETVVTSELEDEKTEVLIDTGFSGYQSFSENQDEDGIPYSLGVFKGVFVFDGRNLLVFETDDGTISFVQVFKQDDRVRWKIYFQLRRI